jgi:hypothetical protein
MENTGRQLLFKLILEDKISVKDIIELADEFKGSASNHPEYILSSTNLDNRETYLFECNETGHILDWEEISSLAYRNGDFDWTNQNKLIAELPADYEFVKTVTNKTRLIQHLYKRK